MWWRMVIKFYIDVIGCDVNERFIIIFLNRIFIACNGANVD